MDTNLYFLTKQMTRDEFLKKYSKNNCPSTVGLNDIDKYECDSFNQIICDRCWEQSLKDVKFKGDNINNMKLFSIDIMDDCESTFEIRVGNSKEEIEDKIINKEDNYSCLMWANATEITEVDGYRVILEKI